MTENNTTPVYCLADFGVFLVCRKAEMNRVRSCRFAAVPSAWRRSCWSANVIKRKTSVTCAAKRKKVLACQLNPFLK